MSFRDDILADVVMANIPLLGPDGFDVHTSRVLIRSYTWPVSANGSREVGLGVPTVSEIEILPRPKVRDVGNQGLRVSLIIPQNANGGYSPEQLKPADADGFKYAWIVIGPDGVERGYVPTDIDTREPFFYSVDLIPLDRAIPF